MTVDRDGTVSKRTADKIQLQLTGVSLYVLIVGYAIAVDGDSADTITDVVLLEQFLIVLGVMLVGGLAAQLVFYPGAILDG